MPPRKFVYGDIVKFRRATKDGTPLRRYQTHMDHTATLVHTKILAKEWTDRWPRVVYTVECECGRNVRPQSAFLDLVRRGHESGSSPSPEKQRMLNFLGRFSLGDQRRDGVRIALTAEERIEDLISCLKEKEKFILIARHGLDGSGGRTFRNIGEQLNLSGERIRQIEREAIGKIHAN